MFDFMEENTAFFIIIISVLIYTVFNIYVTKRINKSLYIDDSRRKLHKKFIWLIPFIGPLMIREFWKKGGAEPMKVMTKANKNLDKSTFRESGTGMYPV